MIFQNIIIINNGLLQLGSKYKNEIENYIKENYKHIKSEYGVVKIYDKTYKGWKDICIKH